ncbi:hypothetical protein L6164_031883 [Bauhinia variegata]|uniref:Uncharacterized protein n=1 Tax=Bauhinia variegata TaxID=167791 RepID=A0ACB9KM62_BAUVA|nr:hypothetical protein L6164_031883 [Bauhinia variegata]
MAELRDIHGNPVQLTDEHGNPVKLTDERGNPVHVSGVATTVPPGGAATTTVFGTEKATHGGHTVADMIATEPRTSDRPVAVDQPKVLNEKEPGELRRSSSSSSSSSEDDGQGGRRKKNKGLKDKIKEKLPGGKHKDKEEHPHSTSATTTTSTATGGHHTTTTTTHPDHETKSFMEKIKEKLPGHHTH